MPEAKINFTPAQADAVEARDGSLLVSAAAGSGKTRVLVERAVGLITDPAHPVDADSLLIMTFTNAAAAKLRADITNRLADEVRANPTDARLRKQQILLQRASIGTVDAFCLHFLQQNFTALEIPPDFETADEPTTYRLMNETLSAVLEDAYKDADFCAFADLYDRNRTDGTAGEVVLELFNFTRALPYPKQALEQYAADWQKAELPQDTKWGRELLRAALQRTEGTLRLIHAAQQIAARNEAADKAYSAVLQDDEDRLLLLREILSREDWDKAVATLEELKTWRRLGAIKGGKDSNPAALAASELRDKAKTQITSLKSDFLLCTSAQFEEDRQRAAPLIAALVRVVQTFSEKLYQAKLAEKVLDYADFEHLTLELLTNPDGTSTPLCETVRSRYSYVMVDEYQDTNALQDALYRALANPEGSNLFFVGDIKQSIYRFRQADPSVFIEKQSKWQPYQGKDAQPKGQSGTIALDANFRSAPNVIEGINYLFETFFSENLGGVRYGDGQRLAVGLDKTDYAGSGLCEIDVTTNADTEADAAITAAKIEKMLAEGFQVRDRKVSDGLRPCRQEDFCILLRGRGDFAAYEAALHAKNIPVYADTANDLLDAPHVRPFAALLRVMDNPAQDVELAAVLLSPLFPYTPDDLVRLRKAVPKGSLYGAILHGETEKFAPFLNTLVELRRLARTMPMDRLLEEILAQTGYLAAVGTMPDGPRAREDLLAFCGWASAAGRGGLSALIRAMDAARDGGGLNLGGSAAQTRPGCVSIMTVHRSKGLEFPIVFVANTTHQFNRSDIIRPVLCHRDLGVGLTLRAGSRASRYKTMPYAALAQTIKRETLSEEMRVLYVALTRAQDALFITVPLKKAESELKTPAICAQAEATGAETMQSVNSWAGWLLTAAMLHPASDELWKICGFLPHTCITAASLQITVQPAPEGETEEDPVPIFEADEELKQRILDHFRWQYPGESLREVPIKVSVSAVAHAQKETALERPAFMQKQGMTGAERGTAIHAFMESVPLDQAKICLEDEVKRQIELKLIDPALAQKLDLQRVRPFFEGAVWQRVQKAVRIMREAPFITSLPAFAVKSGATESTADVLVQGIADLVLIFDDHAEILDYKTDRSTDADYYVQEYAAQLRLYHKAFARRIAVPVTKLTIYSFTMEAEINVPLE